MMGFTVSAIIFKYYAVINFYATEALLQPTTKLAPSLTNNGKKSKKNGKTCKNRAKCA
jgi:hypothetical protein